MERCVVQRREKKITDSVKIVDGFGSDAMIRRLEGEEGNYSLHERCR